MRLSDMSIETKGNLKSQVSNRISHIANPDFIMVGTNGNPENDKIYFDNCAKLFPNVPLLQYKHIFGESYTAPALGVYAAAVCLQRGEIPDFLDVRLSDMRCEKQGSLTSHVPNLNTQYSILKSHVANRKSKILCYNHFENKNHTFILLSQIANLDTEYSNLDTKY